MRATIAGGAVYFFVALVPIFLVFAATLVDPERVATLSAGDRQLVLPTVILERTPFAVQVLFFGALVSAILSTASAALLAPAVVIAENVVRPILGECGEKMRLASMRACVAVLAVAVTAMALTSHLSIYQLVNESGKVVLVSAFVPLAAGLFWPPATSRGAHAAIVAGLATWGLCEWLASAVAFPPPLAGLAASVLGMVAGSLSEQRGAPA
jgi:Na+/proline symporter